MKKNWILLLLFATSLFAQEAEVPLHGFVLTTASHHTLPKASLEKVYGIQIFGLDLPSSETTLKEELDPFLQGKTPFNQETARQVKETIYRYYRYYDHPFVIVSIPQQPTNAGAMQIVINESKLGKVDVKGNEWTKTTRYSDYFSTHPGDPISQNRLTRDVNFMNRNPYRQVTVLYSPGEELYTTDLTLEVADRKPYFFYVGFDNTGVPSTGRQRVFAGFSWDQMFGMDQTFFYQYTTNYHVQRFHANSIQYMAMLPWQAIINVYGGFSLMKADLPLPQMQNSGTSVQASIRYITPFLTGRFFNQEIVAGFDLKNTNNTMEFVDTTPTFGQTVNLSQFMLGYRCKYERACTEIDGGVEVYCSPMEWLPNQSNSDFQSLRPGAVNEWIYGVGYLNVKYPLQHNCQLHVRARAEGTSSPLLPSEQLGIGGHASVRGYDERAYNADDGFVGTVEVLLPRFSIYNTKKRNLVNNGYFLFFLDGGFGLDQIFVPETHKVNYLASVGAGFRYALGTYLNARLDYGVRLHNQDDFTGEFGQLHFGISGSY